VSFLALALAVMTASDASDAADAPRWMLRYVDRHIRASGLEAHREGLTVRNGTEVVHLGKVVERCARLDKDACRGELDSWFDVMLHGSATDRPDPAAMSWREVQPMLRVRPYPLEGLDPQLAGVMSQMLGVDSGAGLAFVVVIDTPRTTGLVPRSVAKAWGVDEETVYHAALKQSQLVLPAQMERQSAQLPGPNGGSFEVEAFAGGFYTTSLLVDPGMALDTANHSYLMVAPSRDVVVVYKVESLEVVDVLPALATLGLIGPPPGQSAFSPDLFWWHAGRLHRLPVSEDDGKPHIYASDTFADFLDTLPRP